MDITNIGGSGRGVARGNHRAFRVTDGAASYRVEAKSSPYVWTCKCRVFNNSLRNGNARHCAHITACIDELRSIAQNAGEITPGIICPCGAEEAREYHQTRNGVTTNYYKCGACGLQFNESVEPATPRPRLEPMSTVEAVHACTRCGSTECTKAGRNNGKQVYRCRTCNRRYVISEPGFENIKYSPAIVAAALNSVMSGESYRKVSESIWARYGQRISANTIMRWTTKYTGIMKPFLDALRPITGDVWSVDEAYINVRRSEGERGKRPGNWLWSAIDPRTRFLIATRIAEGSRGVPDVEAILEEAKSMADEADYIITDSLLAYERGTRRAVPNAVHVKTQSISKGFTNMAIERYHNEIREKLKSCRGLNTADSAQVFFDLMRIHHNFVRPHMGLDGRTPAEAAGISTPGVKDAKYRTLIRASSARGRTVAAKLGKLVEHVHVRNKGNVTVTPKEWLDNDVWHEMDMILRGIGFHWVFTKAVRGWILFKDAPQVEIARVISRRRTPL